MILGALFIYAVPNIHAPPVIPSAKTQLKQHDLHSNSSSPTTSPINSSSMSAEQTVTSTSGESAPASGDMPPPTSTEPIMTKEQKIALEKQQEEKLRSKYPQVTKVRNQFHFEELQFLSVCRNVTPLSYLRSVMSELISFPDNCFIFRMRLVVPTAK